MEEERYLAEEDAYNAYIENELMELEKVAKMLPEGGITAIFADEYIREQQLREEYERTIERSDRGGEILQGTWVDTSRGMESSREGRTVSEKIGGRVLEGENAAAQGGQVAGVAEREVGLEEGLAAESGNAEKGLKGLKAGEITAGEQGYKGYKGENGAEGARTAETSELTGTSESAKTAEATVRVEAVRSRVAEWVGRIGAKVRVIERAEDVDNVDARGAIEKGLKVSGWYEVNTGEVCIYAPNVRGVSDVDRTIVHEVVSHKGLRGMLGEKAFNKLCDKTWDMMSEGERAKYESYPGVENIEDDVKRRRAAADEYISHLAEGVDLSEAERSTWRKVMDTIMDFLKKLYSDIKLTEKDLEDIIKASYRRMREAREKGDKGLKVEHEADAESSIKPIGRGVFGNIYDQFRGKSKEALAFLKRTKQGDLLGVFHRNEIGDIDLVWGDEKSGLSHINSKHVGNGKSFSTLDKAVERIEDIIKNGDITFSNGDKVVIKNGDELVTLRRNIREKGKKTADKNWILTAYNEKAADNTSAISVVNKGHAAPTTAYSGDKDTTKTPNVNEEGEKKSVSSVQEQVKTDKSEAYMPNVYTYINGISEGNSAVIREWEREFRDYIGNLGVANIASIEHTIGETQKKLKRLASDKASADYKAYDFITRRLEHRLRELTKEVKGDSGDSSRFSVREGAKKEKHSKEDPQDLTTIIVSSKNADTKIVVSKDKAKENLENLTEIYKGKTKTRGFLHDLRESLGGEKVEQSSYFDFNTNNGEVTLRISNHNANADNVKGDRDVISVIIKSERTKNNYKNSEGVNLTEYAYFKERIAKADGNTLSQIAESIKEMLDTGVYTDKSGIAVVNPANSEFAKTKRADEQTEASEAGLRFRLVDDAKEVEALEKDNKVKGYRNVELHEDGGFTAAMADRLGGNGKKVKTEKFYLDEWRKSDETPEIVKPNGKVDLIKPKGLGTVNDVDYNPYNHHRQDMVNAQFKQAWKRPDLVFVECEIPESDVLSGYQAEKAALPVGVHSWSNGALVLSRYSKATRIVPWEEVAEDWVNRFRDSGVHFDIVPPALLPILQERGIEILPPHKGMGKECNDAYKEWEKSKENTRFRVREGEKKSVDKAEQLRIIQETNPAPNEGSAWVRSLEDIMTFEESLKDSDYVDYAGENFDPSYTWDKVEEALRTGKITVYSSYPIVNGTFVTPSKMEATSYAGGGSVYRAEVRLSDVAWIDPTQGQLATENSIEFKRVASEYRFRVEPIMGNERILEGMRKLEEGETSYVERKFSENKSFEFNSKNFIKGYDDVAYIFKQLEEESVENVFAVLVKKGRPTVIHLGMGSFTQSMVNKAGLNVAVNRIKPDKIYFVHNHPSGVLKSSEQDRVMLEELIETYGSEVVQYGIIINSFTGKYGIFSSEIEGMSYDMPNEESGDRPIKVYSFNKQVYDRDYQPTGTLRSGSEVAAFITSQRLGDREKLGLLVVDNQLRITGNIFLPYTGFTDKNADDIANDITYYTSVMGGTRAFLFGNTSMSELSGKNLSGRVRAYSGGQIQMLDYVEIAGGRNRSAYDEGVRFRFSDSEEEFKATQKEAEEKKGIVMPNLNNAVVEIVDVPEHNFRGSLKDARVEAKEWAKENYAGKEFSMPDNGGVYIINGKAIDKYLDKTSIDNSDNPSLHLSALIKLPEIISNSITGEIHADYKKDKNGNRKFENGIESEDLLVHRLYGAIEIDGVTYRTKTTMLEYLSKDKPNKPHSYEVTKIELLEDRSLSGHLNRSNSSIDVAKLLKGVEKSYDKGKYLLEERGADDVTKGEKEGVRLRVEGEKVKEVFTLSRDNAGDFEYALMESIAGGKYSSTSSNGYHKVGDVLVRVKGHTPNWDNFEDWDTNEPLSDKILNVTVGDYDNSDYRRNKATYEEFIKDHPDVKAVDVEIEDGTTISEALSQIRTSLQERGIDFAFQSNDFWERLYSKENNDLSERVRFRVEDGVEKLGNEVPWGEGETLADAMSRVRKRRNRLAIELSDMERLIDKCTWKSIRRII